MTKNKPLGFSLITIGLCFFFNPYVAAIDFLPDFIGCLLIALGLVPTSRICAVIKEAKRNFLYLAALDAIKQLMLLFIFSNSALGEQEMLLLIVAFLSASLGTLFTVLSMRSLFNGLAWLGDTYQSKALVQIKRGDCSTTERLCRFTVIFIIAKEVVLLLPEFAALLNSTYADSEFIRIYDYIGVMRALAIIPVSILGIIWLCRVISYFVCLGKDKDFLLSVRKKYTDYVEAHPGIRVKARYFVAFLLLSSGAFFLTDFYLDFHNIISDTVGGFLLLLGVLLLAVPRKKLLPAALFASIYTVVATISSRKSYAFASSHIGSDISRSEVVASEYNVMWLWALGEMLCFLLFLLFLLLSLRAVLLKWGGYRPEFRDLEFEARHEKKIRDEFDWILIKCYILGFISAVLSFLFDYLKTWTDAKELRYLARLLEALWIPDFIFGLFFAAYFSYLLTLVFAKINERFEFD